MSRTIKILLILAAAFLFPNAVLAIALNQPIGTVSSVTDLSHYIRTFYTFFVTSAGILATVMIMFGGYRWITAAGNAQRIGEAKETIISAALGLVLALTSYIILNTINPDITALKSLDIPTIQPFSQEGSAAKLCDYDLQINEQMNTPVTCGEVIYITKNNVVSEEQCMGVNSLDDDNYCRVTTVAKLKSGIEMGEITVPNHPQSSGPNPAVFGVNNGPGVWIFGQDRECGVVWWNNSSAQYEVGSLCDEVSVGGKDYRSRCYLDGEFGNFVSDSNIDECDDACDPYRQMTRAEIQAGCGNITNMKCAN
jgi:hypothetical protein